MGIDRLSFSRCSRQEHTHIHATFGRCREVVTVLSQGCSQRARSLREGLRAGCLVRRKLGGGGPANALQWTGGGRAEVRVTAKKGTWGGLSLVGRIYLLCPRRWSRSQPPSRPSASAQGPPRAVPASPLARGVERRAHQQPGGEGGALPGQASVHGGHRRGPRPPGRPQGASVWASASGVQFPAASPQGEREDQAGDLGDCCLPLPLPPGHCLTPTPAGLRFLTGPRGRPAQAP